MANFWDWVNKQANKQPTTGDELLYADALKNQEARNAANNQYAAAAAAAKSGSANSSSLQGTIDPDRTGAAAPPRKGLYDQTGMNATAAKPALWPERDACRTRTERGSRPRRRRSRVRPAAAR